MIAERPGNAAAEQALDEILAAYLKADEAGQPPDRQALLARHPDVADDLAEFFAGQDQFEQLAAPLRAVRQSAVSGVPGGETVDDANVTGPYLPPGRSAGQAHLTVAGEIPGYEILGELGRGGMGVVYKARQVQLKRLVALKMVRAGEHAGEAEVARFRVEAEAVARLQHPNIVQIHEVGEHRGQPYCSLEFVSGGTLAARLAGTPQPPREAATLARTLALAMDVAHKRGIVHRDLKPANVLLTEDGTPKITDFGLAKRLDEDTAQTRTGAVMGTPAYMAPEQALGLKEVGPLADVYALGVILYEMLTGLPPFKAATVLETLEQVRTREPVPVRLYQPKVPRDLETVCLKCLEKDPRKRYGSAGALAEDLERWLDGKPIQARRSRVWERAYRWIRRNPLVATLGALLALAFLGGFAGVFWQWRQTTLALGQAESNLYLQRINLADREAKDNPDRAEVLLDLCPAALRHWEWHYLKRRSQRNWLRVEGHTDQVRCVAYGADGKRVASSGNDRSVRIWDAATGQGLLTLRGHAGWVNSVAFHADGKWLVSASEDGAVKVWDAADGRELRSFQYDLVLWMTLSPDGRLFAVLRTDGLAVHDLETGRALTTIPGRFSGHGKAVAFSPDRRSIAAPLDACLRIWDVQTGKEVHLLDKAMVQGAYSLTFSPDSRRLYASQYQDRYPALRVWDTTTGREIPKALSTPLTVAVMALSPDGRSLATGGYEGIVKVRNTATGKDLHATRTFPDPVVSLAFQPNGKGLAVAAGRDVWLKAWEGQQSQGPISVQAHPGGVTSVAFSPDGSRLVSSGENDRIKVWDGRTERPVQELTAPSKGFNGVAFSKDGRRLLATGRDGAVYSWGSASGEPGRLLRVPGSELTDAAFSPDGRRIATAGSDRAVRVWDAESGQEVLACSGHEAGVWGVSFSPDGRRLATAGGDGTVRLWDATTGLEALTLSGHNSYVLSVAFHPNGRLLASASTDETVRLWDVSAGREVAKLLGHTGPVRGLCFSPDGLRLASASEDGTVRLWDVATGQEALSLPDPDGKVRWVTFSPDGWRLAAANSDGTVKIWDATPLGS